MQAPSRDRRRSPIRAAAAFAAVLSSIAAAPAADAAPFGYVADTAGGQVRVLDLATDTVTATIPVPSPFGVAIANEDATTYLLSACGSGMSCIGGLHVVDTATQSVVDTIDAGEFSVAVALNPVLPRAYVVNNSSNTVSVLDTDAGTTVTTIPVWFWPMSVAVHPDGSKAYVVSQGALIAHVTVIDAATNAAHTFEVGGTAFGSAVHPSGQRLYVTQGCDVQCPGQPDGCDPPFCVSSGSVEVIDTATETMVARIPVGKDPRNIVLNAAGTRGYVANWGNTLGNTVSVLDLTNNTVLETLETGAGPWALGIHPDGTKLYVVNNRDATVTILDIGEEAGAASLRTASKRSTTVPLGGSTQARGSITGGLDVPDGCGDGSLVSPEACDDGNLRDGDGCDHNCRATACGNGIVTTGEQCDDGNLENEDACSPACILTGCGDGKIDAGEACDDGNLAACDACGPDCEVTEPCRCGDGVVNGSDACDDGNTTSGDGCDSGCELELIPGGGPSWNDCYTEWVVVNPGAEPLYDRNGRHSRSQRCADGDARCDGDGAADGDCEFAVTVCIGVTDTQLGCYMNIEPRFEILRPSERDAARSADAAAIRASLEVLHELADDGPDVCSGRMTMRVPLREGRPGKRTISTVASFEEVPGLEDKDTIKLVCTP